MFEDEVGVSDPQGGQAGEDLRQALWAAAEAFQERCVFVGWLVVYFLRGGVCCCARARARKALPLKS